MFLAGPIRRVCAQTRTFIKRRPLPRADGSHFARGGAGDPDGEVDNDDYAGALVEYENGAVGALEGSRVARGPKCEMAFEIYGQKGSARWNFERMNELELYLPAAARCDGFTRVVAGTAHEGHARINPGDRRRFGLRGFENARSGRVFGRFGARLAARDGLGGGFANGARGRCRFGFGAKRRLGDGRRIAPARGAGLL